MTPLPVVPQEQLYRPAVVPRTPARGLLCSRPSCRMTAVHQHHAVSRSTQRKVFGVTYDWLDIGGETILIVVDLCGMCHDQLESGPGGCKARLRWANGWLWYDRAKQYDIENPDGKIMWIDPRSNTIWKLKGYCRGEYKLSERS